MKKLFFFVPAFIISIYFTNVYAKSNSTFRSDITKPLSIMSKDHKMLKGGFTIHFNAFLPSADYGFPVGFFKDPKFKPTFKFGTGIGVDLGNMFKIYSADKIAFGLNVTWLNASYSTITIGTSKLRAIAGSPLRVGPYFTYGLNEYMAVDLFYQAGATYMMIGVNENIDASTALGLTHELGVKYRVSVFSAGVSYRFGNILDSKYKDSSSGTSSGLSIAPSKDDYAFSTSNINIALGFKF